MTTELKTRVSSIASTYDIREPSVCEACGQSFACVARSENCWCAGVELSEVTRAALRTRYERCLCRACLEDHAARK